MGMAFLGLAVHGTYADTGHEGAVRKSVGSYFQTRRVVGSSYTATALWPATVKRADSTCVVNVGSLIWVSTATDSMTGANGTLQHPAITDGFAVKGSTSSIALEGSNTGSLQFTCDNGVATCEVRCLDGMVQ